MKRKWVISLAGAMLAVLTMGATTAYAGDGGNGIPQQIAKLFGNIGSLQSDQSSQQAEIKQLESAVNSLASTLQGMQSDAKSLHDQLHSLSQTVSSQQTEISNLESEVAQLQSGGGQNPGGTGGTPTSTYSVTGTMVDASGAQVGASLYLVAGNGTTYLINHMTNTGQFVYTNIPGRTYAVTTKDPMYPVSSPQTITVNGQNVTNLNVKLGVNLYSVTFKVLKNGQPFVGNVYIQDSSRTFTGGPFTTASDGTFTAEGIAPGTWTISTGIDSSHLSPLGTVTVTDGSSVVQVGQ